MLTKLKSKKDNNEGFTIIEVMIVLAIAGLIMLIVFLAVPALQRTARNTQRKNDASAVASAIANYSSNNGGTLPNNATIASGLVTLNCTTAGPSSGCSSSDTNTETAKLGFYTTAPSFVTAAPATVATGSVYVVIGFNCNTSNTGVGTATPDTAAILYATEPTSTQCIEQ